MASPWSVMPETRKKALQKKNKKHQPVDQKPVVGTFSVKLTPLHPLQVFKYGALQIGPRPMDFKFA